MARRMAACALAVAATWAITPGARAEEPVEPDDDAPDPTELLEEVDAVLSSIEALRGIAAVEPVKREILARDAVMARLVEIVDRDVPPSARESVNRVAVALGLGPSDDTWFDRYLELVRAEVAGFYDDGMETLYVLADTPPLFQAPVLAHELFHAVQDQRWGLDAIFGHSEWITDAGLAAQALVEGDALVVMTAYTIGDAGPLTSASMMRDALAASMRGAAASNTSHAPSAMWVQLVFPYVDGMDFVFAIVRPGDWSAVDAAYLDPPVSTEQVMHPDRYVDRDDPTWLSFDIGSVGGVEQVAVDVLGEAMIGAVCVQLLGDAVSTAACDRAADGWDGDRLEVHGFASDPDRDLVVWASVWDDPDEAAAFVSVMRGLAIPWVGAEPAQAGEGPHGAAWRAVSDQGVMWAERWGDVALLVVDRHGTARRREREAIVDDAVRAVWQTLDRSRYPDL